MVTPARIGKDLHAVQTHANVRTVHVRASVSVVVTQSLHEPCWSEELFAELDTDTCVESANNSISEWHFGLGSQ